MVLLHLISGKDSMTTINLLHPKTLQTLVSYRGFNDWSTDEGLALHKAVVSTHKWGPFEGNTIRGSDVLFHPSELSDSEFPTAEEIARWQSPFLTSFDDAYSLGEFQGVRINKRVMSDRIRDYFLLLNVFPWALVEVVY